MNLVKTVACLAVVAGAPVACMAQAIDFTVDGDALPGQTITISMTAGYGGTDYAVAGIATSVLINEAQGTFSNARLLAPMNGPGTVPGVIGAGSIDGIIAGQLNFPTAGIFADPTNPIGFWAVDFTVDGSLSGPTILDIESMTSKYDVYLERTRATSQSRLVELDEGALQIVIPAPAGGLALLGGLAMVARRRR